ncbi:UDP-N-acetylmuramate dehydrogenase [Desulfovibrio mangrovi]|uniref:UDP-N-acetylmuramate dehydrogenase n=1 Tax=Desulfovibrio mangrovi TaxID=2976983 RepID=UPI0022460087|nr:UDP-N-acetylmuramate dehydrogenase [Desulfovibrio mangrovi]UZP67298.1 UDP-N-acetylmuramate dehydrogenase [Desulfovibrio mangrovi]
MSLVILQGPTLRERTTLRLGGSTIAEVVIARAQDCDELSLALERLGGKPLVLGYGSNILASDGELPLVVVNPAVMDAPQVVGEGTDGVRVRVGAGFRLPRLLGWLCSNGLSGLEGLSGIPGTVGGAVAMNAGSYGCETGARLESVTIFDPRNGVRTLKRDSLHFAYRHFSVEETDGASGDTSLTIVLDATFCLDRGVRDDIHRVMRENYAKKKATQPVTAYSAGCVFKNPSQQASAGKLLDSCGFKGKEYGGMAFSKMHANFLINTGKGTSEEAKYLLSIAQEKVKKETNFSLELEVKII